MTLPMINVAVVQSIVWSMLEDLDVLHLLQRSVQSYVLIPQYRVERELPFDELSLYRTQFPLLTTAIVSAWNSLSYDRLIAAKPLGLMIRHCHPHSATIIGNDVVPSSVRYLGLSDEHIGDAGAVALSVLLQDNTTLLDLDLRGNFISETGATALAAALQQNSSLRSLNLYDNRISEDGAKALAAGLEHNSSLTHLDLCYNNIKNDGVKALATALINNISLKQLDLRNNYISNDGANLLATSLQHNRTLDKLYLHGNLIKDDLSKMIAIERLVI